MLSKLKNKIKSCKLSHWWHAWQPPNLFIHTTNTMHGWSEELQTIYRFFSSTKPYSFINSLVFKNSPKYWLQQNYQGTLVHFLQQYTLSWWRWLLWNLIHFPTLVFFIIRLASGYSTLVLQLFCLQYLQEIGEFIKFSIILKLGKE